MSELTGSLPCVRCTYDLRGLSILGQCPECGTPVRATLLAVVDPRAGELQPIYRPRLTQAGLIAWSVFGLTAALAAWVLWLIIILPFHQADRHLPALRVVIVVSVLLSGLGSLALINPHPGIRARSRGMALGGALSYAPLLLVLWALLFKHGAAPRLSGSMAWVATDEVRTLLGLALAACLAAVVLLLRPNARLLAARSVLLREGRVDRQTLLALAAVLLLAAVGDSLSLLGLSVPAGETILMVGQSLLLVAALLFTLGLVGVVADCVRIGRVVAQPPISLESLVEPQPALPTSKTANQPRP